MFRLYGCIVHQVLARIGDPFRYVKGYVVADSLDDVEKYFIKEFRADFPFEPRSNLAVQITALDEALAEKILASPQLLAGLSFHWSSEEVYHDRGNYWAGDRYVHMKNCFASKISFAAVKTSEITGTGLLQDSVNEVPKRIVEAVYGKVLFGSLPSEEIPVSMIPHEESGPILAVYRKKLGKQYITSCWGMCEGGKKAMLLPPDDISCEVYDLNPVLNQASHVLVEQYGAQIKAVALYVDFLLLSGFEIVGDGAVVVDLNNLMPPMPPEPTPAVPTPKAVKIGKKSWLSWLFG